MRQKLIAHSRPFAHKRSLILRIPLYADFRSGPPSASCRTRITEGGFRKKRGREREQEGLDEVVKRLIAQPSLPGIGRRPVESRFLGQSPFPCARTRFIVTRSRTSVRHRWHSDDNDSSRVAKSAVTQCAEIRAAFQASSFLLSAMLLISNVGEGGATLTKVEHSSLPNRDATIPDDTPRRRGIRSKSADWSRERFASEEEGLRSRLHYVRRYHRWSYLFPSGWTDRVRHTRARAHAYDRTYVSQTLRLFLSFCFPYFLPFPRLPSWCRAELVD